MMGISQVLNGENHAMIARSIFEQLAGKTFSIITSHSVLPREKLDIKKILGCRLAGEFKIVGGKMEMPLVPRRRIYWDIEEEKVTVSFKGNGVIEISRVLSGNKRVLYRSIVPNPDPT